MRLENLGESVAALRLSSAGGTFVPPDALRATTAKPDDQPEGERQRRSDGLDLTPRELSVIDLLREGKPNKLIGRELEMQESTVKVHVRNILKKLNATNRTHAAFVANRLLGKDAEPVALPRCEAAPNRDPAEFCPIHVRDEPAGSVLRQGEEVRFALDSLLEGGVYCELVSEVGFRRVANKARFQGVYG